MDKEAHVKKALEDGAALWEEVMRSAQPLTGKHRNRALSPGAPAVPRQQQLNRVSSPLIPSQADRATRHGQRARRGGMEVGARLDLHGCRWEAARVAVHRFIGHCRRQGVRCALIITGKGTNGDGILRRSVPCWLREDKALTPWVVSVRTAHPKDGGEGALYVWLRRGDQA